MWNTADIHLKLGGVGQLIYRRLFRYTAWLFYGIARGCHFFKLRYNPQQKRMEETQYNHMISKIVVAVKCLLLLHDVVNYLVLGLAVWICFSKVDNAEGQNYTMNLLIQGILMYVFRRIFFFLHSEADRKVMMHMLNEIFYITCTIEKKYGMNYHIEMSLLCVYSCKMCLMYIMLDALWHRFTFWIIFLYWMLLEYCFHGYLIYQLLLLNWYRNLNYVLQRFLENNQSESFISGRYHRRLLWLFKLYLRINNLHKFIQENIAWFPAAIYLGIFSSIFNMTLMIQCIVYAEDDIDDKLYILMDGCLCPAVIPILNVLIIGICTDRIRSEELTMQQHIVLVSVLLFRKSDPHDFRLKVINSEYFSLIVSQKLDPLLNTIILDTICDRSFAFDYFFTTILTAISLLQYSVSTSKSFKECVIHN